MRMIQLRRWMFGTIRLLFADLWLGRLVIAAVTSTISAVCLLAVCASPVFTVQTVLSERALDAYLLRALDGVVAFQRTHRRYPDQMELDAIAEETAEGRTALVFAISVPGRAVTPPPENVQLAFEREAGTAVVMSSPRSSTIETSWAEIGHDFLPTVLGLIAVAFVSGALAKMSMPSARLRRQSSANLD